MSKSKKQKKEKIDKDIQELQELLDSLDSSNEEENTGESEETAETAEENYENCYECTDKDCEFSLHGKMYIPELDLPLFIGGLIADEIMTNICRNMIHIIEIKDALFSIEDEEIREEALGRVEMIKSNLCNTMELINKAPDTVYETA